MFPNTPTIIPIQIDSNHQVNSFLDTTLAQAIANARFAVQGQVEQFNVQLKAAYLRAFDNIAQNVMAGRGDGLVFPKPPMAFTMGYVTDPVIATAQWPYPMVGTVPVCDMPPIPGTGKHELGTALIGIRISGSQYFQCIEGDTTAAETVVPGVSKDGVTGLFRKVGSPFGTNVNTGAIGGWWLLIG